MQCKVQMEQWDGTVGPKCLEACPHLMYLINENSKIPFSLLCIVSLWGHQWNLFDSCSSPKEENHGLCLQTCCSMCLGLIYFAGYAMESGRPEVPPDGSSGFTNFE